MNLLIIQTISTNGKTSRKRKKKSLTALKIAHKNLRKRPENDVLIALTV